MHATQIKLSETNAEHQVGGTLLGRKGLGVMGDSNGKWKCPKVSKYT